MKIKKFFLIIMVVPFIFGCQKKPEIKKENTQEVVPVKVMRVKSINISETIEYVGDIKAKDEVLVYPKVSGKVIEKIKEDGSLVKKEEPILYIDRDEVGLKFEKAPVESPLAGVVGRIYVDLGESVNMQTPVAKVLDLSKVKIKLEIPEKYLARISLGQKAKIYVDAYPEKEFTGEVTKISPVLDLDTRTFPIEIMVENSEHLLKSGLFAKVTLIISEHKNVPVILKEAIIGRGPDLYVFTVEGNKAVLKNIKLGLRQGQFYEVIEGVKEGDLVVIMGQQKLKEGTEVTIEETDNYPL
ncbi:MAG: efflux RND transporter periplasmic adaptor subunit [Candidatus Omnitrophica bacterium]|nr:efflux RND transporter periplasmic adaptor subunit [Candidatus Omnitrophota bacterium]MCM8793331.1 efflux RND transporter periplasmic adaptor subunit [Candidatus Omnitrophota bacterium]